VFVEAANSEKARAPCPSPPNGNRRSLIAALAILFAGYPALCAWLLTHGGIRVVGDGVVYVQAAEDLSQGRPLPEFLRSRFVYVCLIAICQCTGIGLGALVAFQILSAGIAAIALYDLGRRLCGPWAGIVAAAILLLNPDLIRWHAFILTDSLYISSVIIASWAMNWALLHGKVGYGLAIGILALAAFLRPNGWILVFLAGCYWFFSLTTRLRVRVAGISLAGIAFVAGCFFVLVFHPGLLTNSPDTMLRRGEVIWGFPASRLSMPSETDTDDGGLSGAIGYVLRHPLASTKLAAVRVFTEMAHTRPFYSRAHNLFCLIFLVPVYVLAVSGFLRRCRQPLAWLLMVVIVSHLLVQAVNYADWDGRFLLYVLPLIGVLAACGLVDLAAWIHAAFCWRRAADQVKHPRQSAK
jgi:4-amino-4-deoxy-L-arabinose transferase-like glycosyltransferase